MSIDDDEDSPRRKARRETTDRRVPPPFRETLLNEADRALARVVIREMEKHLGASFKELRERDDLLKEILPTLQAIHDSYRWRADLFRWWLTTAGRIALGTFTTVVLVAVLYGLVPAVRLVVDRALQ